MYELENGEAPGELTLNPDYQCQPMVVLSPDSVPQDVQICRELGTQGYLLRPQPGALERQTGSRGRSSRAAGASLAILIVEDNLLNQQLAAALLRGWGHRIEVANNGIEALLLHEKKVFDLILMDLQMPEMGGFEAAAAILERERATPNKTVIMAITASIAPRDREKCMAAGMDDYLPKPLKADMVAAMLSKHFPSAEMPVPGPVEGGKFDYAAALANADAEVVGLIAAMFLEQAPAHLRKMRWAWEADDLAILQRQAHAMTGLLGTFLAEPARRIAEEIDLSILEKRPVKGPGVFDALEREVAELSPHLAPFAKPAAAK